MTTAHLTSLSAKHANLEATLLREGQHPLPDTLRIASLKKAKLKIKEEIARRA